MKKSLISLMLVLILCLSGCSKDNVPVKDSFEVSFTVPSEWVERFSGSVIKDFFIDYEYILFYEKDGSWTFTMSKDDYEDLRETIRGNIIGLISQYIDTEEYPNIEKIEHNEELNFFKVYVKEDEIEQFNENSLAFTLIYWSIFYNMFSGVGFEDAVVEFYNLNEEKLIRYNSSNAFYLYSELQDM